jgi:hypothetical protein
VRIWGRGVAALTAALAAMATSASVAAAAPYEPNDSFLQATGPMVGGQNYEGAIETSNDVDWFYFNVNGQRQYDITLTSVSGSGCYDQDLYDSEGAYITDGSWDGLNSHILRTSPSSAQYAVKVTGTTSCKYRLRIDPADALTTTSPGVVVHVNGAREADDIQRLYLDGALVGTVQGVTGQSFSLGQLAPTSQIVIEAQNTTGQWSWNTSITNQTERIKTTLFSESQSGGSSQTPRVGLVRRVVLTASGAAVASCGEALAPVTCIPVDNDGDGFATDRDCDDSNQAVRPGARELANNTADEDCDGLLAYSTKATLKRTGARYSGRVSSSGSGCAAGRRVVLKRSAGGRALGSATTRRDGTFTIRRNRRAGGRVLVVVEARSVATSLCRTVSSKRIRG